MTVTQFVDLTRSAPAYTHATLWDGLNVSLHPHTLIKSRMLQSDTKPIESEQSFKEAQPFVVRLGSPESGTQVDPNANILVVPTCLHRQLLLYPNTLVMQVAESRELCVQSLGAYLHGMSVTRWAFRHLSPWAK